MLPIDVPKKWNFPHWLAGGLIILPVSLVLIPLSFFVIHAWGAGEGSGWYIAPEFYLAAMDLAMRGTPADMAETISTFLTAGGIFLIRNFFIGAILGLVYSWFFRRKTLFFVALLVIVYGCFLFYVSYTTQNVYQVFSEQDSVAECSSAENRLINNFLPSNCIRELAIRKKDPNLCGQISTVGVTHSLEDEQAFCYEEVAHAIDDPSFCALVPTQGRRDSCYVWFDVCEKIIDESWRQSCLEEKAGLRP